MSTMIVTNLRIAEPDWRQIKAVAGEMGMSVNKYINHLIRRMMVKDQLGIVDDYKDSNIWEELPKLANIKNKPGKLNEDDEIIYA